MRQNFWKISVVSFCTPFFLLLITLWIAGVLVFSIQGFGANSFQALAEWRTLQALTHQAFTLESEKRKGVDYSGSEFEKSLREVWLGQMDSFENSLLILKTSFVRWFLGRDVSEKIDRAFDVWLLQKAKLYDGDLLLQEILRSPLGGKLLGVGYVDLVETYVSGSHPESVFKDKMWLFYRLQDNLTSLVVSGEVFVDVLSQVKDDIDRKEDWAIFFIVFIALFLSLFIIIFSYFYFKQSNHRLLQSEEKFRALAETSSDWIWQVDVDKRITYSSLKIEDILGYAPSEMMGHLATDFYLADEAVRVEKELNKVFTQQRSFSDLETVAQHKDGQKIILESNGVPIFDEQGCLIGYQGINRDITARKKQDEDLKNAYDNLECTVKERTQDLKKAYDDLKDTQDRLLQAEKLASLGELSAGIAHEVNNPTSFIISNLDIAQEPLRKCLLSLLEVEGLSLKAGASSKEALDEIKQKLEHVFQSDEFCFVKNELGPVIDEALHGATRIKDIVTGLTHFAHPSAHERAVVSIRSVVEGALLLAQSKIKYKVDVVEDYDGSLFIWGNAQQLEQVFINLLVNAAYAIENKGSITIRGYQKGQEVFIEFSDTGCGIVSEHLSKIFDPFFTTKEVGEGTGLGLSIIYGIIKDHGGSIAVESVVAQGTTFMIHLPSADIEDSSAV